ncbi:MAG: hypothetical protein J6W84_06345 [Bacteroidales bacterium]|nr:hypothetical protein [Bacteroidales bacterium]
MSEFYVICVDSGILLELTVGKMYRVSQNTIYGGNELNNPLFDFSRIHGANILIDPIENVHDLNLLSVDWFGARFIAAERICGIDE